MKLLLRLCAWILLGSSLAFAESPNAELLPPEIRDYKSWAAFPNVPAVAIDPTLCSIPPMLREYGANKQAPKGPHKDKFLSVFFNKEAQRVVEYLRYRPFPVGSIIVKEKHSTNSPEIQGIGVMLKHEPGYDVAVGDWEFMYLDTNNKLTRGNLEAQSCKDCHIRYGKTDYVFGNYAPKDLATRLKDAARSIFVGPSPTK